MTVLDLNIQYVTDQKGKKMAVQIPIKEWKRFLQYERLKKELTSAFKDVRKMQKGEMRKVTMQEFLDSL